MPEKTLKSQDSASSTEPELTDYLYSLELQERMLLLSKKPISMLCPECGPSCKTFNVEARLGNQSVRGADGSITLRLLKRLTDNYEISLISCSTISSKEARLTKLKNPLTIGVRLADGIMSFLLPFTTKSTSA